MISTIEREITMENELRSKIKWACTFSNCEPKIKNGNLRMVEKTNIAYVEPHSVVIKEKLYLFYVDYLSGFYRFLLYIENSCPVSGRTVRQSRNM